MGGNLTFALAERLRITGTEASRRIREADDLRPRRAMAGEPCEPGLAATAEAQRAGRIGAGQLAVIRGFWHRLPDFVDVETREKAEIKAAGTLTDCLNPDGNVTDDRARGRSLVIGKPGIAGMSVTSGHHHSPRTRIGLQQG